MAVAGRSTSSTRRTDPFAEPQPKLSVVSETAQLELPGFVNDMTPAYAAVLHRGLFRMMLGNPTNSCVQIQPAIDGLVNLSIRRDAVDDTLMELGRLRSTLRCDG